MPRTTFELTIRRLRDGSLSADARLTSAASAAAATLASDVPVALDEPALLAASADPAAYGALLGNQLFADPRLRDAWLKARAYAATGDLQLRLNLDAGDPALHALRWEALRDPETGQPIALHERVRLVRALDSRDLTPVVVPPRPELRALVVIASPSNLADFGLAEVDVDGEVGRARTALGDIPTIILGDHADAKGRATLANVAAHLRDAPPIAILIAHGTLVGGSPLLWLEQENGTTEQIAGDAFVEQIGRLAARPLLLILASCRSAGGGYNDTLNALGPRLASAGVPAVLAFQGNVAMSTVKTFLPSLITELRRDGQIDRALAAARTALGDKRPWWQAVLWLRTGGRLWEELSPPISNALVSIGSSQTGDVLIGDVAQGNITKMTINVWVWDRFGKDVPAWLARQVDQREQKKNPQERLKEGEREQLKEADRQRWAHVDWAQAAQTYRQGMLTLYGSMQIFGMNRPVPLSDVFTDVYLLDKPSAWRRHSIEELQRRAELHASSSTPDERHAGGDLVVREQRLFILGQPGAGKTTFLKHLVMEAVQGRINAIPIFVSLKAWADSDLDLMPFLVRQFALCNFPDAQPFIETILEDGKALVLFDGLDEVSDALAQRQHTIQTIREFAQQYGKSRVVITCRTAATEHTFEQFNYCELADFTQAQIESFVGRWFQHNEAKCAAFLEAFARPENHRLSELARRPLLLTMLCLTFEETMAFPQRRAELYDEAIDALLKKWDSSRSIQRDQMYQKLSLGHKRQLLAELAAQSFERSELFLPKRELVDRVVRFLRRLPPVDQSEDIDGEAVLRAIEAQHGLLIERAHGVYSFSHLTFQEYFTARYIAGRPNEAVLRGAVAHGVDIQWREVLLLTASLLDHDTAELFFRLWGGHLQSLAQQESTLTALLTWVVQQTQGRMPLNSSLRVAVLMITLIDQATLIHQHGITEVDDELSKTDRSLLACTIARASEVARNLARAKALPGEVAEALDSASDRARNQTGILDLATDHVRDLTRTLDLASDQVRDLNYAHNLAGAHDLARALAEAHAAARTDNLAHNLAGGRAESLHFVLARARAFADALVNALARACADALVLAQARVLAETLTCALDITRTDLRAEARNLACVLDLARALNHIYEHGARGEQQYASATLDHVTHQDWRLTSEQVATLQTYLDDTLCMLECLELAAVEDRQAVLDRILIPPEAAAAS